jgi:putative membrane protein
MIVRKSMRLGPLLRRSWRRILIVAGYVSLVVFINQNGVAALTVPLAIPAMLGTAISILLGFRTNSAYARWWEARQIWGAIVNDSRTWARQVMSLFALPEGSDNEAMKVMQRELVYRQIAWSYVLARSLRRQDPFADVQALFTPKEIDALRSQDNRTNALLQTQANRLYGALHDGYLDTLRLLRLEDVLTRMCDHMGKCERIKNTVFPAHYSFFVTVIIWLFFLLLPLGLVDSLGWLAAPAAFTIAIVFWMIEGMGQAMQDPFENYDSDTPMLALCRTIEINLRQQLGETELPEKAQPVHGVLM